METRTLRSRILFAAGALGILVGSFDPLEGAPLIVAGTTAVTLAAFLGHSRHRRFFSWGLPLVVVGVSALYGLSAVGGIGGNTGRPMWWSIAVAPYAIGWLITVIGVVLTAIDFFRRLEPSSAR